MKYLEAIWKFINSKVFVYVVIIILILLFARQCKRGADLKRENIKKDQNVAAADSIINIYKNKNGELTAEKTIWILSEKELKEENKELYDLVKNQKGRIISLNTTVLKLEQDATILHDSINYLHATIGDAEQLNKTEWNLPWELQYTWDANNCDIFKGHTIVDVDTNTNMVTHKNTLMDFRDSRIDLVFGEKVVDGKYNVFITSKYPGLTPKSMKGVFIDPNTNKDIKKLIGKKHWFTGFSLSIGITPTWDFIQKQPTIVIGPALGYSIYQW